jgi:hypothetical protein
MALRRCLDCPRLTSRSRCPEHERARSRARGTTTQRGYDANHQRLRRKWQRLLNNAWGLGQAGLACWRCKQPILWDQPWDLGHYDNSRITAGPEHRTCNRATATRRRP